MNTYTITVYKVKGDADIINNCVADFWREDRGMFIVETTTNTYVYNLMNVSNMVSDRKTVFPPEGIPVKEEEKECTDCGTCGECSEQMPAERKSRIPPRR